jgi:ABC-2 type transport system permease protein
MTTTAVRTSHVPGAHLTTGGILRSEWTKLRSLRSTVWSLIVAVALIIGLGALFSWGTMASWDQMDAGDKAIFDPTATSLSGGIFAQLAFGVLGVLLISGEYSTGMIRSTMLAIPKRLPALWAKVAIFAVLTFVITEVSAFVAFAIGQELLRATGASAELGDPGVTRALIGFGLYVTGVGLFGMGLGALMRHTAGAISTLVGVFFVLEIVINLVPSSWREHIHKFLPGSAGTQVLMVYHDPEMLAPWTGFALFCVYLAVLLGVAAWLLKRRDV